jgi:endonuclease/exonuclease/phosphatase family metal-dependent hydrolase
MLRLGLLSLGLSLAACGGDEGGEQPPPPKTVTAATYNAGLAIGFVEASEARAPITMDAIAALAADLLCVQEVWRADHVQLLKDKTASKLANTTFITPDIGTPGPAACTPTDTTDLVTCVTDNGCDLVCSDQLASCAQKHCIMQIGALPSQCLGCITTNIGNDLDTIIDNCQSASTEFAYQGSFGVGMLTSHEVLDSDTIVLDSTTNRRGIIYNKVDTPLGEIHAFCTHLTAVFSDIPYPGTMFGGWDEEQLAQIDAMRAWIDEKVGTEGGQVIMMGDFNAGPDGGSAYVGEVVSNYDALIGGGYANIYTDTPGHACTFCADNPIIAKEDSNDDKTSAVIDHVLIKGFETGSASADAARIMTDPISVDNCEETIGTALSDHYGVSIKFTASN